MKKLLSLLLLTALLFSCNSEKKRAIQEKKNKEAEVFMAQTIKGNLLTTDEISIRFVDELVKDEDLNKPLDAKIFSFRPRIKGSAYWKTTSTLAFKPAAPLKYKKTYKGKLDFRILKCAQLPDSLTIYTFDFNITGRNIEAYKGDFQLKNSNSPKFFNFQGEVTFSEVTTLEEVQKCVHFKSDNNTVAMKFEPKQDKRSFSFKSDEITRDNDTHVFKLTIDKDILGMENDFEKSYQMTPIDDMRITGINYVTSTKNPKIRIEFSDELSQEQDINGLISLSPMTEFKLQKRNGERF